MANFGYLWFYFAILLVHLALSTSEEEIDTKPTPLEKSRRFVCPNQYVRLGNRCYYFSKMEATWHEAYWNCRDLHGNLAIIRNPYQDKLIRQTLNRAPVSSERWLGGLYDWEKMAWKWAASGKNLTYNGFSVAQPENKEDLRWHCIVADPSLQYRWSWRSCFQQKPFICHSKLKLAPIKKKKVRVHYNNQVNEVPIPEEIIDNSLTNLKDFKPNDEPSNDINAFGHTPKIQRRRKKGNKNRRRRKQMLADEASKINGTVSYETPIVKQGKHKKFNRSRRYKGKELKDASMEHLKWKMYYNDATMSPLHPRRIVEEFVYKPN